MLTLSSKQFVVFKSLGRLGVLSDFEKQISQRCGSLIKAKNPSKTDPVTSKSQAPKMVPVNLKVSDFS